MSKSSPQNRGKRKNGKRGYRLHDERIAYSGGEGSMRSIKYELQGADKQLVIDAVIHDNKRLYGNLNLNDYLADETTANLLDFWLAALSLGFVFSNQNSIEREFNQYLGRKTIEQKVFASLGTELRQTIDEQKFIEFLFKSHRGVEKKTEEKRQKLVLDLLRKDVDDTQIKAIAKKWSQDFSVECDELAFKSEIFGIKKPDLPERVLKLSFAIDPNFEIKTISDRTKFLDEIISFYEVKCGDAQAKRFLCIGDNGNYFNGLFGNLYENLLTDKVEELAGFLNEVYELDGEKEIRSRLNVLRGIAKQIDAPQLVNRWSDYRSDFNGTIESWYSNRVSKQNDTIEQLQTRRELLGQIYEALPESCDIRKGILRETIEFIESEKSANITREFTNELDSYLATLRSDLNEYVQQNKDVKLPSRWQENLSRHIQSSPLFFGENKLALWKQLKNLKSSIRTEAEKLEGYLTRDYEDYEITEKQVDMLAQLFNRITSDGNREVIDTLKRIEKELGVRFTDTAPNKKTGRRQKRYFKAGFEREKIIVLEIPNRIMISKLAKLTDLKKLYKKVKETPQANFVLRDVTQLSKVVLSALIHGSEHERLVNLSHSNLSGYANLISKGEFISRYPVQAINGGQNLLAFDESGRYYYRFSDEKFSEIAKQDLFVANQGNNFSASDFSDKIKSVAALPVQSSRYQIQFLDWFFGKHKKKKAWLSAGGSFTIAEKTCQIDWSDDEPKTIDKRSDRIFISQPFTINPPETRLADQTKIAGRYLGVDIGEYGLAWSLIKAQGDAVEQLESGFINDHQQQTLKTDVKNLRGRQVQATFTSPDTKIARVRESLIGSYRNLLEDLAMRKNARLSFEYEVSGFETGGARISKVYDSIKRGSVAKKDNNSENKQAWGSVKNDNFIWKAFETTAAGTSQFCTKCRHWGSLAVLDNNEYKLEEYEDGLFKTKLDDGRYVRLFAPKNNVGDKIRGKDGLKGMIYKAMRPNDDGAGMEIVKRQKNWAELSKKFGAGKERGNIGIFVCPYIDCHHITDADMQAAFNIAVRGYLKDANPDRAKKSGENGISAKWCCEEEAKLEFGGVELTN
jgi:hypothetical protein